ncbi:MAG TPA: hypothetical protein PKX84_10640 [Bacteroidia bacterium]|nr:hypothetical protein [Bacteroidia bacterium]
MRISKGTGNKWRGCIIFVNKIWIICLRTTISCTYRWIFSANLSENPIGCCRYRDYSTLIS